MTYYPINETLARRANSMNSYSDYVKGSATAAYRAAVDQAAELAEQQKRKVDPIHHEKIDRLLDTYARKLADNTNRRNEIAARVPSILVAGGSNFPVRKKEKQNRADDAAMAEWKEIQGLLDKIRGTGMGGISADDPEAVTKLKEKVTDSSNSVVQERYITLSVHRKSVEEARTFFDRVTADVTTRLSHLDAHSEELDAVERLRVLHDFYRTGSETEFHVDLRDLMRKGHSFKDAICPDSLEFKNSNV